jgi:eukaryotic-like serine/threonine-protein kinase
VAGEEEETSRTAAATVSDVSGEDESSVHDNVRVANRARHADVSFLGAGGMGTVHLVTDRVLERRTVMKRIHSHLAGDARSAHMFVREAQITGQLEHPSIVPVHELGVDDHENLFFTMKLVEGRTFEQMIRALPPGPLEHSTLIDMLEIVVRICDALSFAHSRGVVHGDVKPANVMVGDFGEVYLMDWGVARRMGEVDERERRSGETVFVGTPSYMAPEQARGLLAELDERTDVFAIGAMLYHLLARVPPYPGRNFWEIVPLAQEGRWRPLDAAARQIPRPLVEIVSKAMAPDPADRFLSVRALQEALVGFSRGRDSFPKRTFQAGETIVSEGEHGDAAYIVESGLCSVWRTIDGQRVRLRQMGPGEVFGETAILASSPRSATVIADEHTVVHVVTAEVLEREMAAMKPWMGAFVRTLAKRFREREAPRT